MQGEDETGVGYYLSFSSFSISGALPVLSTIVKKHSLQQRVGKLIMVDDYLTAVGQLSVD